MSIEFNEISFDMPKTQSNVIKVIGVGGGGTNAVNHMYEKQIIGVDFVICNTDAQALDNSPIPNKIQLGINLTSGLGAGANPEVGAQAASESIKDIEEMLGSHTKMIFITAGMGGGTGTGAAPIIAKVAKEMGILTVGIVTKPFSFEGKMRTKQAEKGIHELRKNVDSLIIINNDKLREVYGNLGFKAGFAKADEVLATGAKAIAEVITHHYKQNIDLHDAKTVLANSGTAIMGSAIEEGEDKAKKAIIKALDSPLLNDNKITGAKNVLLLIVSGAKEVTFDEIGEINDYIQKEAGNSAEIIMGLGEDESLGDAIAVTVVATGFAKSKQSELGNMEPSKIIHTLDSEQTSKPISLVSNRENNDIEEEEIVEDKKVVYNLEEFEEKQQLQTEIELERNIQEEVIEIENIDEDDFIITDVKVQQEEKIEEEVIVESQEDLLINFPLTEDKKEDIINEVTEIEEQVVEKRFVLEEETDEIKVRKQNTLNFPEDDVEEDMQLKFSTKTEEEIITNNNNNLNEDVSPLNLTISELKKKSKERSEKMREFNYRFTNTANRNIEDLDNEPAYKRRGIDINVTGELSKTKTALKKDLSDFPLNTNNSFLHDNVD